ncbi:MAG: hypothetical protein AAF431_02430 [Pseudomonadota bacterium]
MSERQLKTKDLMPEYYQYFVKAYVSYLCLEKGKNAHALSSVVYALRDLIELIAPEGVLISELSLVHLKKYERTIESIFSSYSCESRGIVLSALVQFLTEQKMLSNSIAYSNPFSRKPSFLTVSTRREKKMPALPILNAVAEIYSKVMFDTKNELPCDRERTMDRIACAQTSLLFAAPMRIGELFLLGVNPLHKIKAQGSETYAIRWRGSKGMPDHEKHVHKDMLPTVKKSIAYLEALGSEARVLARYYENPSISRQELFKGCEYGSTTTSTHNAGIDLWELAGILNLYDEQELAELKEIIYWPGSEKYTNLQTNESQAVRFGVLCPDFPFNVDPKTVVSYQIARNIFKFSLDDNLPFLGIGHFITMGDLESKWVSYVRESLPGFPYLYQGTEGKRVKYSQALFVIRGDQVSPLAASYHFGSSRFAIQKTSGLANVWSSRGRNTKRNLFEKYGYDTSEYHLNTHQVRHFLNTLAQRADLNEEIIAMWSGRKSSSQNKVYNHESQTEIEAKLSAKGFIESSKSIVPVTEEEVKDAIGTEFAARTDKGYCSQSLYVNPCTNLKIGSGGCVGCPSHCHVKGDLVGLANLESDTEIQTLRVTNMKSENISSNVIMQRWLNLHLHNLKLMNALMEMLKGSELEDGSIVRYSRGSTFVVMLGDEKRSIEWELRLPASVESVLKEYDVETNEEPGKDTESDFLKLIESIDSDTQASSRLSTIRRKP